MGPRRIATPLAALVLGMAAHAQLTSLPPVCFGINDTSPWAPFGPAFPISTPGGLTVWFSAPMSTTIDAIELPFTFSWGGPMTVVDLYVAPAIGAPPLTPSLATFFPADLGGWVPFLTTTPAPVTQGGSYALTLTAFPFSGGTTGCSSILYDPNAAFTLPYQMNAPSCPPTTLPPSGAMGLIARFRGTPCGPGPLASAVVVGTHCGVAITGGYTLVAGYPALGTSWSVTLWSPPGTAYLFWALGTNAAGLPIVPGSSCLHYLDPASLTLLWSLGSEPLAQAAFQNAPSWSFQIPASPAFAGTVFGLQALVLGTTGTIPLAPGVTAHTSNALNVTLGYSYP